MGNLKELKNKIISFPDAPGVYIFKDSQGRILYIGKAKALKKRAQSYFSRELSSKAQIMVSKIADAEYILAVSESQAQLLEASLIKEKQPPYNTSLKDDKSFPLLRISDEDFPVISICRKKKKRPKDTALYFGPYTNAADLRQALKLIRKLFGFRSCKKMPEKICLYGRLKLCPAPCAGKVSLRRYRETIKDILMFLDSKYERLLDTLSLRMQERSRQRRFEEAASIRDQVNALGAIAHTPRSSFGFTPLESPVFQHGEKYSELTRGLKPRVSFLTEFSQLEDLKNLLKLDKPPKRIEAFDISNIFGREACGSMVSFYNGLADKNNYRRFRIRTVADIDDYKMLSEVIQRRYSRLIREHSPLPDLILIDGGRSHLLAADRQLRKSGLEIPLISIAKGRENIYIKESPRPIRLISDTPALNLIRRIRDEAHRFAVSYHRILRRKKIIGK